MRLPNFLLVGAQKSGTTSLYHYLKQHPQIFMPSIKEPKFFSAQFLDLPPKGPGDARNTYTRNYEDYVKLFSSASSEIAIGEASADNLIYHNNTISLIKHYLGNIKIVILLRNPTDRAFSSFTYLLRDQRETLSFEQGLAIEEERIKNNWYSIWYYKRGGFYYEQVKDYLDNFDNVEICLFDDLVSSPNRVLARLFDFLSVDPSFTIASLHRYNVSGIPRRRTLHLFLKEPNVFKTVLKPFVGLLISEDRKRRLREKLMEINIVKPQMNPETVRYLKDSYKEEILRLQALISRDLTHWLD
jgi:hypothetical protein